ncbi:MAG TPA: peptide ABC transporter substrate-binding protein [Chloroflexota bacterium]
MTQLVQRCRLITFVFVAVAVACAPPGGGKPSDAGSAAPRAEKHIVYGAPNVLDIHPTIGVGPRQSILPFIGAGLSASDGLGNRMPLLTDQLPSVDNGSWTVGANGTMVTTFHLRPGALWHDGVPITANDFVFSLRIAKGGVGANLGGPSYASIAGAEAADPQTLVVRWKEPNNAADAIFSWDQPYGAPLPEHVLGDVLAANPDALLDLPYWESEYIGSGPFKVVSWEPGVQIQLAAHDGYALGRPKLDRIEIRLVEDPNTLISNLLAGTVDATVNLGSADAAKQLSEQWQDGNVIFNLGSGTLSAMLPQFVDPNPKAISDVRFRTALAYGTDRQSIVDGVMLGYSPVPLSFLTRGQPQYAALEAGLPRYEYDPQRAAQMLTDLGYVKGVDGTLRDAGGQQLTVEVRSAANGPRQQLERAATAVADDWHRLGVAASPLPVQVARANDVEYLSTFQGFFLTSRVADAEGLGSYASDHSPVKSNNYRAPSPQNYGRFTSTEVDGLIAKYFQTIPPGQRAEVMGQIVRQLTEQVAFLGLWYTVGFGARNNRLTGVAPQWPSTNIGWSAYSWDVSG